MNEMLGMSGSQTGPEEGMRRKVGRGKMMLMMKQEDGERERKL